MTIGEHAQSFAGLPVKDYDPQTGIQDPTGRIYRLRLDWDALDSGEGIPDLLDQFLADRRSRDVPGIVIGAFAVADDDSAPVVEALVAARDRLPHLRAIFLGDITYEENEISWIHQSDVSPLFEAYPDLEHFRVRGNEGLSLGTPRHEKLRSLIVESGGLSARVVRQVGRARLPRLEHLELWLGTEEYGADATVEDLEPILAGDRFPNLRYLGLRDSYIADQVAAAVAVAPVLERLRVLDLSLGTLGDEGARALLQSPAVARLERLDLHHHYIGDELMARLRRLGPEVDLSQQEEADSDDQDDRYVAVGE